MYPRGGWRLAVGVFLYHPMHYYFYFFETGPFSETGAFTCILKLEFRSRAYTPSTLPTEHLPLPWAETNPRLLLLSQWTLAVCSYRQHPEHHVLVSSHNSHNKNKVKQSIVLLTERSPFAIEKWTQFGKRWSLADAIGSSLLGIKLW